MIVKVDNIIITESFKKHSPNINKLDAYRKHYSETGVIDKKIIINDKNELIDGYIGYLVAKENNITELDVELDRVKTKLVYAKHPGNEKEFVWRLPKKHFAIEYNKGDKILVNTKLGNKPVFVERTEIVDMSNNELAAIKKVIVTKKSR